MDDSAAAALAGAFALDLASWDEDNPGRRTDVLARYLDVVDVEELGWNGSGRQRAEVALPGKVTRHDDTHVTVDVRVRITPYLRLDVHPLFPPPQHQPDGRAVPAAAPSPDAPGWVACDSEWIRVQIPIARTATGGLAVDLSAPPTTASRTRGAS